MSGLGLRRVPVQSRREHVVEILRDAVTTGALQPGDRLVELDLATELGTSRAPVREALRQLEQEGLVASYPYRGTEVLGVSQTEIDEVLVPIRAVLERFAFGQAATRLTDADLDALQQLVDQMRKPSEADREDQLADLDIKFHEFVIERSEQQHCLQIWRSIQTRVRAYFRRDATRYTSPDAVADQHQDLLDQLRTRDPGHIVKAIDDHVHTYLDPTKAIRR